MACHGRSLRPPTPCLAKTDPKNIARAEDENASETLLLGSLPRPYHALQYQLVPVASRKSHWWLPILFPTVFFGGYPCNTHRLHMFHNLHRLHHSHPRQFSADVFESALTGVVIFTSNLVKWNLYIKKTWLSCRESLVSLHYGVGVQPHEFHLNKDHDNMTGKLWRSEARSLRWFPLVAPSLYIESKRTCCFHFLHGHPSLGGSIQSFYSLQTLLHHNVCVVSHLDFEPLWSLHAGHSFNAQAIVCKGDYLTSHKQCIIKYVK